MRRYMRKALHEPGLSIPLMVAGMMILTSVIVSKLVLDRLAETQQTHFRQLTGAFLDGLSTALHPYLLRREPWEVYDGIDRARARYSGIESRLVLAVLSDETVLAASDPIRFPYASRAPAFSRYEPGSESLDTLEPTVWVHREIREGGARVGRLAAEIDVRQLQQVRHETLRNLILFNTTLTLIFAAVGWLVVRRTMYPLLHLSELLAQSGDGRLEPIGRSDLPPADTDVGRAYRRYNAAAQAIAEREALLHRLAEEERRALIGRYASAMAHEVNNPLGGLFNAVQMIQRHGDDREQRLKAARLIERGLMGIHNIVRATLMTWRGEADVRTLTSADVKDVRQLIASEAARREIDLDWQVTGPEEYSVPAQAFRQIALNLLLNACAATPPGGHVHCGIAASGGGLKLTVRDNGPGMPADARATLLGQEESAGAAIGLGLWSVSRLSQSLGGRIEIAGPPGATVIVEFPTRNDDLRIRAVA